MKPAAALKTLLGDIVTLYFQAHGSHWNVEGHDFSQYHTLFGEIYADVYDIVDPLAENIRKLGEYAPFNLQAFIDDRTIDFKSVKPGEKELAKSLLSSVDKTIDSTLKAFHAANDADEQGIANFLAEVHDRLKKWKWFLTASTK